MSTLVQAIKNPPSIATGGFQNRYVYIHLHGRSPQEAAAILTAFSNAFNKHMFCYVSHCSVFPCFLLYVLVIQLYLCLVNNYFRFLIKNFGAPGGTWTPMFFNASFWVRCVCQFHHWGKSVQSRYQHLSSTTLTGPAAFKQLCVSFSTI